MASNVFASFSRAAWTGESPTWNLPVNRTPSRNCDSEPPFDLPAGAAWLTARGYHGQVAAPAGPSLRRIGTWRDAAVVASPTRSGGGCRDQGRAREQVRIAPAPEFRRPRSLLAWCPCAPGLSSRCDRTPPPPEPPDAPRRDRAGSHGGRVGE